LYGKGNAINESNEINVNVKNSLLIKLKFETSVIETEG
jgi:hypothetical protein